MSTRKRNQSLLALDGPPPLGLGLRRFLLRSVGPPEARFHPLDLSLVTAAGTAAHRALCVLPNTGGKSTLLKLLSSVVNPGTAGLIGKGEIADMVLATDTAHVVLEWQQADGTRYVTAWLAEWPGLQKPESGGRVPKQHWYTFRVGDIGIESLPFEYEGRRIRSDEYCRQMRALFVQHPAAAGVLVSTQAEWRQALAERTRIDAELFLYQAKMNAAESGAAALVTRLKTAEAVVGFFVDAFDDDRRTAGMFKQVSAYLAQASNRATMETHAGLCGELAEAVDRFQVAQAEYDTAVDMELFDVEGLRELAGAVLARAALEREHAAAAQQAFEVAEVALTATNRRIVTDEDRRRQYLLVEAELRLAAAEQARQDADVSQQEAELAHKAWSKVDAIIAAEAAEAAYGQAQAAFDAAERELAPLRARVEVAAQRLVAGLLARAEQATLAAKEAQRLMDQARGREEVAGFSRDAARDALALAQRELEAGDAQVSAAGRLLEESRAAGRIGPTETAAQANVRWTAARNDAGERHRQAVGSWDRARGEREVARAEQAAAQLRHQQALSDVKAANTTLTSASLSATRLLAEANLVAVLGLPPDDLPAHRSVPAPAAAHAASVLDDQAAVVERSAMDTWATLESLAGELARLAGTDLLDAGRDVADALRVLQEAHIGALTGWSWLADQVAAEERLAFISARPDIANGVVVNDPARLDEAQRTLEKAGLFPRLAVAVTTSKAASLTADDPPADAAQSGIGSRFVVEPHPGLYDKAKAAEEIARLQADHDMLTNRHAEQAARGRSLRASAGAARNHATEWPDERVTTTEDERDAGQQRVAEALDQMASTAAGINAADQKEAAAVSATEVAAKEQAVAGEAERLLGPVAAAEDAAASHAAARPGILDEIERHKRAETVATEAIRAAREGAERAAGERRTSLEVAGVDKDWAAQLGARAAGTVPEEPVHMLAAAHRALAEHLSSEAAGRDHLATLERAREEVARAAAPLNAVEGTVLARARHLSGTVLASSPGAVRTQQEAAELAWRAAVDRAAQRQQEAKRWSDQVEERRPSDRQVHAVLVGDERAVDADDAAQRASALNAQLAAARALRDSQQAVADAADAARTQAKAAAAEFGRLVTDQDSPHSPADPYPGDVDAAGEALAAGRGAVTLAKKQVAESKLARQEAAATVNNRASNRRWGDITDSLRERCGSAGPDELAEHGPAYLQGLRTRERSLRDDIADLDTHRSAVINSLGQTCEQINRSLRRVKAASTIPSTVFGVGGQQAITIDFKRLPAEAADAELASVIDSWAAQGTGGPMDPKTRQIRLMEALSATVERRPEAGRWSVKMLKPRIDGDVTYCTPDRITREYSGGQELTLAVLLYCTLAAVRADDRTGTDRPPGLLLLDNPFGAASSERLIQMQQELAAAADVQLLCFTALSEPSILNGFNGPGTFRHVLRNDRNQRNGYQHVRAVGADEATQARVSAHLAGPLLETDEQARVSGIGYQTLVPFPAEAPDAARGPATSGMSGTS
jgi:hypothetical protein